MTDAARDVISIWSDKMTWIFSKLGFFNKFVTSLLIVVTTGVAGCSKVGERTIEQTEENEETNPVDGRSVLAFAEREQFVAVVLEVDKITQGMKRSQVEAVLNKHDLQIDDTPPFGPSFNDGGQRYSLEFCNDELSYASWVLPNNERFLRSFDQRTNKEGFDAFSINASVTHDDRRNSDSSVMNIHLYHPSGAKAFTITYHLFPDNAQIALRDSRYGHNCKARESASQSLNQ